METKEPEIQKQTESQSELLYRTRSEEVQEIIGHMPSWIIRWGITVIGLLVLGAFIFAALMRSPELVSCNVIIANTEPPAIIHSPETTQIKELLVKEGDYVANNSPLAVLDNRMAPYKGVLEAKQIAQAIDTSFNVKQALEKLQLKEHVSLGQLQHLYVDLSVSVKNYLRNISAKGQEYKRLQDIRLNARKLMAACDGWEQQYLLTSTAAGQVHFLKTLHNNTPVKAEEAIMGIVKPGNTAVTLTGQVPLASYSKLKEGQIILIQADTYPVQEFGMLKGKISRLPVIPVDGFYTLEIELSNGLVTTTGQKIVCPSELHAIGDIILQDKSLLQKLLETTHL